MVRHRLILQPWFKQSCQMLPLVDSLRQSRKSKPFPPPFSYSSRKNTNFEINPREHPVKRNYVTRVNPEDDGERGVVSCQSVAGSIFFSMNFSRAGNKPAHNHIHADRYLALSEKSRHCSWSILESTRPTRRTRTLVYIYIYIRLS